MCELLITLKNIVVRRRIFGYVTLRRLEGMFCTMCILPQETGQYCCYIISVNTVQFYYRRYFQTKEVKTAHSDV